MWKRSGTNEKCLVTCASDSVGQQCRTAMLYTWIVPLTDNVQWSTCEAKWHDRHHFDNCVPLRRQIILHMTSVLLKNLSQSQEYQLTVSLEHSPSLQSSHLSTALPPCRAGLQQGFYQ